MEQIANLKRLIFAMNENRREAKKAAAVLFLMLSFVMTAFATVAIVVSRVLEGNWSETGLLLKAYCLLLTGWCVYLVYMYRKDPDGLITLLDDKHELDPPEEGAKPRR